MASISLIKFGRLVGSNTALGMARTLGVTSPPPISVRALVESFGLPLQPTDLKLFWDLNSAGQVIFRPPGVTGVPLDKTIQFDWRDSADTPARKAKSFLLDIKVAATGQEFVAPGGLSCPFSSFGPGLGTTGFKPNTRYSWNVTALNDFGTGESSETFTFQTVGPTIPPPVKPQISVSSSGTGQSSVFVITGSGFLKNHFVNITIADDALHTLNLQQSSDGQGNLNARFGLPCTSRLGLHFTATDGRPDPTNVITQTLESNTFDIPCP
jgi:hypothetical protein